jgi:hypothetical protein
VEPRGSVLVIGVCPLRGHLESLTLLFFVFDCLITMRWAHHEVLSQDRPKFNGAMWPWNKTFETLRQNKSPLFTSWLSQMFCDSSGKLTNMSISIRSTLPGSLPKPSFKSCSIWYQSPAFLITPTALWLYHDLIQSQIPREIVNNLYIPESSYWQRNWQNLKKISTSGSWRHHKKKMPKSRGFICLCKNYLG